MQNKVVTATIVWPSGAEPSFKPTLTLLYPSSTHLFCPISCVLNIIYTV